MKDAANITEAARLAPTLMGFIFYEKSPRYAGDLDPQVVRSLPGSINPVGVFVNASVAEIDTICSRYGIKIVQLHGDESPEFCLKLKEKDYTVLKAFGIGQNADWERIKPYEGAVDMFVFDTATPARGGSGQKFDWQLLDTYPLATAYLLSGGIGPDDIDRVIAAMRPKMAGIDVNSRFETAPRIKDIDLLRNFILKLHHHNEN